MAKIRLIENMVGGAEPTFKFKPTNRQPETPMGANVNREIKKQTAVRGLNEVDVNLSEEEKSRKKKVFKLAKMEALVHNDEKLTSIFNKILEDDPSEKFGYHWNETVMNILFNDYVLNNPVYFEKYKNAIPVKKKRRDMSGINQLRQDDDQPEMKVAAEQQVHEVNLFGGGRFDTSAWFVQPTQFKPNDLLVFDKKSRTLIDILSHENLAAQLPKYKAMVNKGIEIVDPRSTTYQNLNLALSSYKIPKELVNTLKSILAGKEKGEMTPALNEQDMEETTGAAASGSFEQPLEEKKIEETTTSMSSGQYSQPGIWAKDKKNMRFARKPAWSGGQIVSESYLTDPNCFNGYIKALEIDDFINETYDMAEQVFAESPEQMDGMQRRKFVEHMKNLMKMTAQRMGIEPEEYKEHFITILDDLKKEILAVEPSTKFNDVEGGSGDKPVHEDHLDNTEDKAKFVSRQVCGLPPDSVDNVYHAVEKEKGMDENNDQAVVQAIKKDIAAQGGAQAGAQGSAQAPKADNTKQWNGNWNENESEIRKVDPNAPDMGSDSSLDAFNLDEYSFDDDQMHFSDVKTRSARNKVTVGNLVKFAQTNPSIDQINAFASSMRMDVNGIHELANHYLENNLGYSGGIDTPEQKALVDLIAIIDDSLQSQEPTGEVIGDIEENANAGSQTVTDLIDAAEQQGYIKGMDRSAQYVTVAAKKVAAEYDALPDDKKQALASQYFNNYLKMIGKLNVKESMIDQPESSISMAGSTAMSMKNKDADTGSDGGISVGGGMTMGGNVDDLSTQQPSDLSVATMDNIDNPLKMNEERKTNSQINLDKIKKENEKNTNADMKKADGLSHEKTYGFKAEPNDMKKAAQYPADKDFYIDADTKAVSAEELEKAALKKFDDKKLVKRNNTPEEDKALNMNRGDGMQDLNFDNKPSEKFEDRMKADMGDDIYKARQDKMAMKADMSMYKKETQPTGGESKDNKFAKKYNSEDMNETLSASYFDSMGKRRIVEFKINDVKPTATVDNTFVKLEMSGFGNQYNNKVNENTYVTTELDKYNFYIKGSEIFKSEKVSINESKHDENYKKMLHLMNYNPTKYVKK